MKLLRPAFVFVAAILAVVASVAVAAARAESRRATAVVSAPLRQPLPSAVLVCAAAAAANGVTTSTITASAPSNGPGTLTISRFGSRSGPPVATAAAGTGLVRYSVPGTKGGPYVIRATGAQARGLSASVVTRTNAGGARGLSTVQCTAPTGQSWIVGGGASVGRLSRIYLSNVDPTPATVNLTIYTTKGAQQPTPAQGVQVPPSGQVAVDVDALVPGQGAVAVQISATSGRVASAMVDAQQAGLTRQGVDWVPPSVPPAREVVIAGIPGVAATGPPAGDPIARTLSLLVPGSLDANVSVRLVTGGGTLSPPALATLSVPAGKLDQINLAAYASSAPFGVTISSDQPLVASVRTLEGAPGSTQEFSYATGVAPIEGSVVLPYAVSPPGQGTALQLVNPGSRDLGVTIGSAAEGTAGPGPVTRVTVPAGRIVQIRVGGTSASALPMSIQVTGSPTPTELRVGWVFSEQGTNGPLVTGGGVPQTPLEQIAPPVLSDPAVGFPGH